MHLSIPASAALWFLPFVLPVCLWVIWTDLTRMKIPNSAVYALFGIYAVIGLIALPFEVYAWQWLNFVIMLLLGFVLWNLRMMGAGDAKFIAVMAPFFILADAPVFLRLYIAVALAAVAVHRLALAIPATWGVAGDWESWKRQERSTHWLKATFPKGTVLGSLLAIYLGLGALYGA